ncbi:MAG: 5'/3'-nucleotidase SurE [Synergistaceae bacterium]|jgi:5'-nucleotidase|nr:5'/3'-nucleotidase SurE [Synergistaceae bacterium]
MKILVSNDDGVYAPGIVLLSNHLAERGHVVTVVAPDFERSGAGHSITTDRSLSLRREASPEYGGAVRVFGCSGTPADCVMAGLHLAEPEAELVLSGINSGPNLGCDVYYSGTVAAAREGYFENRRSVAVSLSRASRLEDAHYETALAAVDALIERSDVFLRTVACLNVNVPNLPLSMVRGLRMTFAGRRRYENRVRLSVDANENSDKNPDEETRWFRVGGTPLWDEDPEGSDVRAVSEGFVALTFLRYDTTDYGLNGDVDPEVVQKIKLR